MSACLMNFTQLLTLTMALRKVLKYKYMPKQRAGTLSVSWWGGSCLRLSRAMYYQTWRHLSGTDTTMTLYQAFCEGGPDQSSYTASTNSHEAISTMVEIWGKEGKECSHYRKQMGPSMWWTLAGAHRIRCQSDHSVWESQLADPSEQNDRH